MANKIYNQDKIYAGNFSLNYFDGLNIGAITTFAGDTVPDGYLECDGSEVSRTTYAELFLVIGEKFGAGDGSASFNLPKIIDATAPTLKYLIKATTSGSVVNNATNTTRGFVRFATDSEAEFSLKEDVALNPKHLKLAVSKTDSRSKIYGTDSDGKQALYDIIEFTREIFDNIHPIGSYSFGVKPSIGTWEEISPKGKYLHNITLRDNDTVMQFMTFINDDGSVLNTADKLCKTLYDNGYRSVSTAIQSTGHNTTALSYSGAYSPNGTQLYCYKIATKTWATTGWAEYYDKVTTLIDYIVYKRTA